MDDDEVMEDDDWPLTPLADWRVFWDFPEELSDGPTKIEFEADEAITAAEWPQLGEGWMLAINYTAWDMIPHRLFGPGMDDQRQIASVRTDSPDLRSHLEIEVDEHRLRFLVVSQDEMPVQPPDVAVWSALVTEASKRTRAPKEMEWFAVIGAEPLGQFDAPDQRLVQAAPLADLKLTPIDKLEEERVIAGLGTHERRSFSPVLVQGICRSWHDWGVDAEEEGIQVRRLCALLSVAWNGCWTVKLLPQNRGLDQLDLKPPGKIEPPDPKLVFPPDDCIG
jgi:hypothetical protein